jgi:cadmium resistance protein CadD (predicted permease)
VAYPVLTCCETAIRASAPRQARIAVCRRLEDSAIVGWLWQAIVLFTVTNVDDLILLALFFARSRAAGGAGRGIVLGQYLGFLVILVACLAGALGAGQLSDRDIGYLGILPILLGLWAAWQGWRGGADQPPAGTSWWAVAAVTVANSGDNIGVYVPAFAGRSAATLAGFTATFLLLVAVWCSLGRLLTAHPAVIAALRRWGHLLTPIALIAIGCVILVEHGSLG